LSFATQKEAAMPRYYFNIHDDAGVIRDEEGMELPDLAAARTEAQEGARELLADALRAHKDVNGKRMEITDADGTVLESFKVRDMLN
jgi:hypothetical protein